MITYSTLYIKVTFFKYTIFALGNIFNFFFLEIIQFNSTFRLYYSRPNKIRNVPSSCVILPRRKSHNMHADIEFHFFILVSAFFFFKFPLKQYCINNLSSFKKVNSVSLISKPQSGQDNQNHLESFIFLKFFNQQCSHSSQWTKKGPIRTYKLCKIRAKFYFLQGI